MRATRRSLVTGTAWTVPLVATVTAAPAVAASTPVDDVCLDLAWAASQFLRVEPDGANRWQFELGPDWARCSAPGAITSVEVWTSYGEPAVTQPGSGPQLVATVAIPDLADPDWVDVPFDAWVVPPVDDQGRSLLPGYYDPDAAGEASLCTDQSREDCSPPCVRLLRDQTFLVVSYRTAAGLELRSTLTGRGSPCLGG